MSISTTGVDPVSVLGVGGAESRGDVGPENGTSQASSGVGNGRGIPLPSPSRLEGLGERRSSPAKNWHILASKNTFGTWNDSAYRASEIFCSPFFCFPRTRYGYFQWKDWDIYPGYVGYIQCMSKYWGGARAPPGL